MKKTLHDVVPIDEDTEDNLICNQRLRQYGERGIPFEQVARELGYQILEDPQSAPAGPVGKHSISIAQK